MTSDAQRGKKRVDLTARAPVRSRIRRDPPPKPMKLLTPEEVRRREAWSVALGIALFSLLLFMILIVLGRGPSWTPAEFTLIFRDG